MFLKQIYKNTELYYYTGSENIGLRCCHEGLKVISIWSNYIF
jgi:hypothetical protein